MKDSYETLEKKLKLAMACLEAYAKRENWRNIYPNEVEWYPVAREIKWKKEKGYELAEKRLKQIKEMGR